MENKDFKDNEEIMETVNYAIEKSQATKGEVTTLVLMNLPAIYEMVRTGATNTDVATRLGINIRTWNKIRTTNKQVGSVVKQAQEDMTDLVKQSLFNMTQLRAVKQQKVLSNGKIVEYESIIQPDPNMVKFFLLNKASDEFRDKQEVEVTKREFIVTIIDDDGNDITPPAVDVDYKVVPDNNENKT